MRLRGEEATQGGGRRCRINPMRGGGAEEIGEGGGDRGSGEEADGRGGGDAAAGRGGDAAAGRGGDAAAWGGDQSERGDERSRDGGGD
ncbi:hypothetical protein OsJ_21603 [Oryza sativa Japonica Group]|nr:hypothetical protein OsJ_21603 [Oryza sativa Japonica Group]